MKKFLMLSAVLALIGAGCVPVRPPVAPPTQSATAPSEVPPPPAGAPVTLKPGETAMFNGGLSLTLKIINDSRCPKGVTCIWAGELSAVLEAKTESGGSEEVTLGTITKPLVSALGYAFELKAITTTSVTLSVTRKLMM